MDVHNAFLNGDLCEEVHISIPPGLARQGVNNAKVCKLHKSFDGIKQAPRQRNYVLIHLVFQQSHFDYSLFIRHSHCISLCK